MDESDSSLSAIALMAILAATDRDAYERLIAEVYGRLDEARQCAVAEAAIAAAFAAQDAYAASMDFADGTAVRKVDVPDHETASAVDLADAVESAGLLAVGLAAGKTGAAAERAVNAGVKAVHLSQEVRRISGRDSLSPNGVTTSKN